MWTEKFERHPVTLSPPTAEGGGPISEYPLDVVRLRLSPNSLQKENTRGFDLFYTQKNNILPVEFFFCALWRKHYVQRRKLQHTFYSWDRKARKPKCRGFHVKINHNVHWEWSVNVIACGTCAPAWISVHCEHRVAWNRSRSCILHRCVFAIVPPIVGQMKLTHKKFIEFTFLYNIFNMRSNFSTFALIFSSSTLTCWRKSFLRRHHRRRNGLQSLLQEFQNVRTDDGLLRNALQVRPSEQTGFLCPRLARKESRGQTVIDRQVGGCVFIHLDFWFVVDLFSIFQLINKRKNLLH